MGGCVHDLVYLCLNKNWSTNIEYLDKLELILTSSQM